MKSVYLVLDTQNDLVSEEGPNAKELRRQPGALQPGHDVRRVDFAA